MPADLFPTATVERRALRAKVEAAYTPPARGAALMSRMSFHCAGVVRSRRNMAGHPQPHPWHAYEGGCADTGISCLCPCHDKEIR